LNIIGIILKLIRYPLYIHYPCLVGRAPYAFSRFQNTVTKETLITLSIRSLNRKRV